MSMRLYLAASDHQCITRNGTSGRQLEGLSACSGPPFGACPQDIRGTQSHSCADRPSSDQCLLYQLKRQIRETEDALALRKLAQERRADGLVASR